MIRLASRAIDGNVDSITFIVDAMERLSGKCMNA